MSKTTLLLLLIACAGKCVAQDVLGVRETGKRDLAGGETYSYLVNLAPGDYVAATLAQSNKIDISIFVPDGSRLRRFPGGDGRGERDLAFVAETGGRYRIELTNPQSGPSTYTLTLKELLPLEERMKLISRDERNRSPRIEALRKQVASGPIETAAFWQQVKGEGTPLVEQLPNDPAHLLVTFLYQGNATTRNVFVLASFHNRPFLDHTMIRLGDTDVWYVSLELPRGARFSYRLSPNDPLTDPGLEDGGPRSAQRNATLQSDPLNPHRWGCVATASRFACLSEVELPGAAPQPWIVKNSAIPTGKIEKQTFASQILHNERSVSIYTPPDYKSNGTPYSLLLVFDESEYLDAIPAPVILDNLAAASKIAPTVAVLIGNAGSNSREVELSPNEDFVRSLATELIPWVRAQYNVTQDPARTTIAGASLGGLTAAFAGMRHPEIFGNILCQSPSFWWAPGYNIGVDIDATTETGWIIREFANTPKLPLRFYIDAGVFEIDSSGSGSSILELSRRMRDVLQAKGYEVHYQQFAGGHDFLSWRGTFADGLIALLGSRP